ncbi:hypothetical protein N8844_03815 [Planktomarina temperata]|nr:hypothetical protein [Planktomarina temperata]
MLRIGVIPARSGSKRLKGKNSLPFCGMTLVEISVLCALASRVFDKIIITSDDFSHKQYEKMSDQVVFHARSPNLAADETTSVEVLKDICDHYFLQNEDLICMLQPTSPLRLPSDIKQSIGISSVSVCTKSIDNTWLRHSVRETYKKFNVTYNQDDKTYLGCDQLYFNGSIYWIRMGDLYSHNMLINDKTVLFHMSEFRSIDIDFKNEFDLAEKRFMKLGILNLLGVNNYE